MVYTQDLAIFVDLYTCRYEFDDVDDNLSVLMKTKLMILEVSGGIFQLFDNGD